MGAPIDQRLEKLLALSDKRGMIVEAVQVRGNEIMIIQTSLWNHADKGVLVSTNIAGANRER